MVDPPCDKAYRSSICKGGRKGDCREEMKGRGIVTLAFKTDFCEKVPKNKKMSIFYFTKVVENAMF